jgi:hypothetical protein
MARRVAEVEDREVRRSGVQQSLLLLTVPVCFSSADGRNLIQKTEKRFELTQVAREKKTIVLPDRKDEGPVL